MINRWTSAFARPFSLDDCEQPVDSQRGMTLRAYISAHVLAGIASSPDLSWSNERTQQVAAKASVEFADALIKELNK